MARGPGQQHEDFLKGEYKKIQEIRLKEIEALNHELDRKKGSEALARQEVFQEMSKKVAEVEAQKLAEAAWLKNELAQRDAALSEVRAAKDTATEDFSRRMEVIVSEHRDLVLRLSGATVKGQKNNQIINARHQTISHYGYNIHRAMGSRDMGFRTL